jgi:alanine dehydrogenase
MYRQGTAYAYRGAGLGSAITDDEYKAAGATILNTAAEVWQTAEMLVKVKEPLESEYALMREHQLVYTLLPLCGGQAVA